MNEGIPSQPVAAGASATREGHAEPSADFGGHEVLDRAHIIEDMIAGFICGHPVVKDDSELEKAASALHQAAFDFYQMCGRRFLND